MSASLPFSSTKCRFPCSEGGLLFHSFSAAKAPGFAMASAPSASALTAVLRCRGNLLARKQANAKRPPAGSGYSLGLKCGAVAEVGPPAAGADRGGEQLWTFHRWSAFLQERVEEWSDFSVRVKRSTGDTELPEKSSLLPGFRSRHGGEGGRAPCSGTDPQLSKRLDGAARPTSLSVSVRIARSLNCDAEAGVRWNGWVALRDRCRSLGSVLSDVLRRALRNSGGLRRLRSCGAHWGAARRQ